MEIIISGTVGVGKSTVAKKVYELLKLKNEQKITICDELKENNPYLSYYYNNRPEWSFIIQVDFLMSRFKSITSNKINTHSKKDIQIYDRHFLDDLIFANLKYVKEDMNSLQWNHYKNLNDHLTNEINKTSKPDFIFLLKAPFEDIRKRISKRNRNEEREVDIEYWKDLYYQYYENNKTFEYLKNNCKKMIILDANKPINEIANEIIEYIKK